MVVNIQAYCEFAYPFALLIFVSQCIQSVQRWHRPQPFCWSQQPSRKNIAWATWHRHKPRSAFCWSVPRSEVDPVDPWKSLELNGKKSTDDRGGQFTGNFCARELKKQFYVTVVDCKDWSTWGDCWSRRASNKPQQRYRHPTVAVSRVLYNTLYNKFSWAKKVVWTCFKAVDFFGYSSGKQSGGQRRFPSKNSKEKV